MKEYKCSFCERCFDKFQSMGAHERWCNPETKPDHSGEKNPMWGKGHLAKNQWSNYDWESVPFEDLGLQRKRIFLLNEANHKCTICGFSQTRQDGTVILQIDHIDGDRKNNSKSNLRVLCPNCHAVHSHKFMHIGQKHSKISKDKIRDSNKRRCIPSVS